MADSFTLNAAARTETGKAYSRRMRRLEDRVPGILYGGDAEPTQVSFGHDDLSHALANEAFYSHIITITHEDGVSEKAVLREVQRHPAKARILHVDFLRVDESRDIRVLVPLHFINEESCIGVKQSGGAVTHNMSEVEVSCRPSALPEFLEVDVAELDLGSSLHLSDIVLPEGVTIVQLTYGSDHDLPIVSVVATRASRSDEAAAELEARDAGDEEAAEEDGDAAEE